MMKKGLLIAFAAMSAVAFAATAEAKTVKVKGKVVWGPLPFCLSVGGYDISSASPSPAPGSCVKVSGKVAKDQISLCMVGTVLTGVKVAPAKGCK